MIRAPDGMSSLNAFAALYSCKDSNLAESATPPPCSEQALIELFRTHCPTRYCKEINGKLIGTDFGVFPNLNTTAFDRHYGAGAAQKALQLYHAQQDKVDPLDCGSLFSPPLSAISER